MANECNCNSVNALPIFRFQSTPQDPPTAYQIETSQKQVEDFLNQLKTALVADLDCLCEALEDLEARIETLEP